MSRTKTEHKPGLAACFPPSPPCECAVCRTFCHRPGWWSEEEAERAMRAGLGPRMMLELSPERTFGVLSPAFNGCEGGFALAEMAERGCNFYKAKRCELFNSGLEPLECRFCHHDRLHQGPACHAALEQDWRRPVAQVLVERWVRQRGLWAIYTQVLSKK